MNNAFDARLAVIEEPMPDRGHEKLFALETDYEVYGKEDGWMQKGDEKEIKAKRSICFFFRYSRTEGKRKREKKKRKKKR